MARIVFEGLTKDQVRVFADWFEGQGEQDCEIWFDEQGIKPPLVDVRTPYEECGDDLIVYCK